MGIERGFLKKEHNGATNECFTAADKYVVALPYNEADAALILAAI